RNGLADSFPIDNFYLNFSTVSPPFILEPGWNLISLSKKQVNTNVNDVFESLDGQYDAIRRYDSYDSTDPWKHHHILKPPELNDLEDVNHTMGLWIHITNPSKTKFYDYGEAFQVNQSILLYSGWNLVGYPSLTSYNRTDGLNNVDYLTQINKIMCYNASLEAWYTMNETDYFNRGQGYWIHAKEDLVWEVPL
ncbi:MAG: hypothetical protein ACXACA_05380, partial [Candidatus Ranarchaeia archaeon]